jgi:hypothetical protein
MSEEPLFSAHGFTLDDEVLEDEGLDGDDGFTVEGILVENLFCVLESSKPYGISALW